jgi:hypothetical protein
LSVEVVDAGLVVVVGSGSANGGGGRPRSPTSTIACTGDRPTCMRTHTLRRLPPWS